MSFSLRREPSGWIPVAMSLVALALVFGHLARYGTIRQPDEGAAARIFQLLLVGQVPIIGYFAATRLPRDPKPAIRTILLQLAAAFAALATVWWLERP